jgi:uncharacterized tellurite resistance protein B-like protein
VDFFKKILGTPDQGGETGSSGERSSDDIRVATCAVFLELASIDDEFSEEERQQILSMMQDEYGVSREHAVALAEAANRQLAESIDVWQFTNQINESYTEDEKMRVVELLWRLVYADGKLDAHEDYLMHKLGKLLRLQHKQLIAAKLRVLHEDEEGD